MINRAFNKKLDADGVIRITPNRKKCSACGGKIDLRDLATAFCGPVLCIGCSDPRKVDPTRTKTKA